MDDMDVDETPTQSNQVPTNKVLALQTANDFIARMNRLNTIDQTYVFKMLKIYFSGNGSALEFLR